MVKILDNQFQPSDLVTAPCPHFEDCGACHFQHVKTEVYRQYKEQQLYKLMDENGIAPIQRLPSIYIGDGARRRVTFSAIRHDNTLTIGFHRYHDTVIAPVESCLLLTPTLSRVYAKLRDNILSILPRGVEVDILLQEADKNLVDCVISGLSEIEDVRIQAKQTSMVAKLAEECEIRRISFKSAAHAEPIPQIELESITKTSGALTVEIFPGSFLQPSAEGEEALSQAVVKALGKLNKRDKILDLFSGCGTFAGRVLQYSHVHAIEGDIGMSQSLIKSAKGHARFTAEFRDLFKEPVSVRELREYKAVILDPPRAGAKEQCTKLAKSEVPLIVSVSCNPATFARDAKILLAGGYKLQTIQMIDQFIYSTHSELVGVFKR
jgi:23S rRNA (uracil1939-C5)-methyltransferase